MHFIPFSKFLHIWGFFTANQRSARVDRSWEFKSLQQTLQGLPPGTPTGKENAMDLQTHRIGQAELEKVKEAVEP